jgi:hypothetical protein
MLDYDSLRVIWWLLLGLLLVGFAALELYRRYDHRPEIRVDDQELIANLAHARNTLNEYQQRLALLVSRYGAA